MEAVVINATGLRKRRARLWNESNTRGTGHNGPENLDTGAGQHKP